MKLPTIKNNDVNLRIAIIWCTISALVLVAPLEHSAGLALRLNWWHAWAITALIEGASATAILSGHFVYIALFLTGSSTLLGSLWSAHAIPHTKPAYLALGITLLTVASLVLVHSVRKKLNKNTEAKRLRERTLEREQEEIRHSRELRLAQLTAEQERERAERDAQERAAQRRHEAEMQRAAAFDAQERERLAIERERQQALIEQTRAEREREQARIEREQAARERRASAEQAEHERQQAEHERERAYGERLQADRDFAKDEWLKYQWPTTELAAKLSLSETRARALVKEWRKLHAIEAEA